MLRRPLAAAAAFLLFLSAGVAAAAERTVVDAAGRTVAIGDTSRIVSVGGSVTEILFALGVADRIIAVDLTSTFPAATSEKQNIGYMRTLSPEGVLSVNPSIVIAIQGSGPQDAIEVLEHAAVPFVLVPEATDADGIARKIRFIADVVGEKERGEALAAAVLADIATFQSERAAISQRRKAVFVLSMGGGAPMVAGEGTAANAVFAMAGIDNALSGFKGYKPANEEATLASQPDAVVVMTERGESITPAAVFSGAAFAGSPAAQEKRLVAIPGTYLLGFGPRTAHALRDLVAGIYPETPPAPLPERPWTLYAP